MNELNDYQPKDNHTTPENLVPISEKPSIRDPSSIAIILEFQVETTKISLSCN